LFKSFFAKTKHLVLSCGRRAAGVAWRACRAWRARHGGAMTFCDIIWHYLSFL